ncbi:LOB domain-containing protein 22 [Coffea eugenioides]|uniref:LOB domain-containing protein 22-like n=1 Tax=Coffea arabica TaxID=13443 RepID=A0ABM4U6G9_COFAR|nr:LOB domain-containing protein 22 [Coffea eugenioides]
MHNTNVPIARVNTTQACAACKYQRRKCAPDCILAPYFPHDRQRQFLNAHKLFGVSNITKIIRILDQPEKDAAMRTIIFQSDVRASDPVGGCYRIIRQLQRQIEYTKLELDFVLHQLALCRAQAQAQAQVQAHQHQRQQQMLVPAEDATDSTSQYCDMFGADPLGSYEQLHINYHHLQPQPPLDQYIIQNDNNVALQEVATNSWGMQGSSSSSMMPVTTKQHSANDCNDFKPLFDGISDDPHDFRFESEEPIDHRSDEQAMLKGDQAALKEDESSFHCVRDHHDLKVTMPHHYQETTISDSSFLP